MQISNEMKQYNIIGKPYYNHLINKDYAMALEVAREISAHLKTLPANTFMYGDNFGWPTASELLDANENRIQWLRRLCEQQKLIPVV